MSKKSKKLRSRKASEKSADLESPNEEQPTLCRHITGATNGNQVRKALDSASKNGAHDWRRCNVCQRSRDASKEGSESEKTYGICLQCGAVNCWNPEMNDNHCSDHFKTPRSSVHSLVLLTSDWTVCCFTCNFTMTPPVSKRLLEVVGMVRKHVDKLGTISQNVVDNQPLSLGFSRNETTPAIETENSKFAPRGKSSIQSDMPSIRGLTNNGNTCFFNSSLQSLSQCHYLTQILEAHSQSQENFRIPAPAPRRSICDNENMSFEDLEIQLCQSEPLVQDAVSHFRLMVASSALRGPVNPGSLFTKLCKRAVQFEGGEQHDAQELLRHFLEQIRQDEVKRYRIGILNAFQLSSKTTPNEVDERTHAKVKRYGRRAGQNTVVDWVFCGQFINTIVCEECYHYSQRIESFLDISLPILDEKVLRHGTKHEDEGEPSDLLQSKKKKLEKLGRKPKGRAKELLKKEQRRQSAQQKSVASECSKNDEPGTAEDVKPASALLPEHETPDSISASADEADEESFNGGDGDVEDNLDTYGSRGCSSPRGISADAVSVNSEHSASSCDSGVEPSGKVPPPPEEPEQTCQTINDSGWTSMDNGNVDTSPITKSRCSVDDDVNHTISEMAALSLETEKISEDMILKRWATLCQDRSGVKRTRQGNSSVNVDMLLTHFTSPEILSGCNKFACDKCNDVSNDVHPSSDSDEEKMKSKAEKKKKLHLSNASRQALILMPPAVLTLHFKRFEQTSSFTLRKVNKQVEFPFVLDLTPYVAKPARVLAPEGNSLILYSLFAVVEHSGSLRGGHYTAYVKVRKPQAIEEVRKMLNVDLDGDVDSYFQKFLTCWRETNEKSPSFFDETFATDVVAQHEKEVPGVWYHASDTHTAKVSADRVAKAQAYLLFYERVL